MLKNSRNIRSYLCRYFFIPNKCALHAQICFKLPPCLSSSITFEQTSQLEHSRDVGAVHAREHRSCGTREDGEHQPEVADRQRAERRQQRLASPVQHHEHRPAAES